ncbi:MAG: ABC transporter ATP-binding protein [Planctomycetota bacterium]|nr:ABC transporter ATP-binding protein [Planctomycetota bacterium]
MTRASTLSANPSASPASTIQGGPSGAGGRSPVVACQRLTKTFKDFWMRDRARAVDGVDFEIRPREIFGLLGPNGSGKSTTIKLILGLLKPSKGRVAVFGKSPTDVAIKKRIGYLPEESYLYPFLNARETLDYYGKLFELDHRTRARRIDELIEMVGLGNAQFRPVREYSKGMQRRIGIAQALINDPDFLILDEPTTGLDPIGTRQIKDLIIQLGRRGKTVLLSSHLLADVEDCVDRMVILYGGKIRAEGTCDSLLTTQDRTTLETDALDEQTIEELDRVIRTRTGGERSLIRVTKPRQSLESLFLDIVERARSEQAKTSGATSGGEVAAFLKEQEQGAELIDKLMRSSASSPDDSEASADSGEASAVAENRTGRTGGSAGTAAGATGTGKVTSAGHDDALIGSLISGRRVDETAGAAAPTPSTAPAAAPARSATNTSNTPASANLNAAPRATGASGGAASSQDAPPDDALINQLLSGRGDADGPGRRE